MERNRFRALRAIGNIYKGLGWAALVVSVLMALASVLGGRALGRVGGLGSTVGGWATGIVGAVVILVIGGLIALALYGTGEAIFVGLAIEENTRLGGELLERLEAGSAPVAVQQSRVPEPEVSR